TATEVRAAGQSPVRQAFPHDPDDAVWPPSLYCSGPGMLCVYHGTDLNTGLAFLNNQLPLDAAQAAAAKIDGAPGFFLATDLASAEFFAIRRSPGVVVEFQLWMTRQSSVTRGKRDWLADKDPFPERKTDGLLLLLASGDRRIIPRPVPGYNLRS